jgi:hypothetical protein
MPYIEMWIIFCLAGGLGVAVLLVRWAVRRKVRAMLRIGTHGFDRKALLTGNEIEFLGRLEKALDPHFRVLTQVSMGAVMTTSLSPEHPDYWAVRESYASKIIDFVICDVKTFRPLLVVELDDRMHDFAKDRARDALLSRCGLRTVRFWSRNKPGLADIRAALLKNLGHAPSKTH